MESGDPQRHTISAGQLGRSLGEYARWFATSRQMHAAAERAAQLDAWYAEQAAKPPHPDSTALFMAPEDNARIVADFLRQRAAPGR